MNAQVLKNSQRQSPEDVKLGRQACKHQSEELDLNAHLLILEAQEPLIFNLSQPHNEKVQAGVIALLNGKTDVEVEAFIISKDIQYHFLHSLEHILVLKHLLLPLVAGILDDLREDV